MNEYECQKCLEIFTDLDLRLHQWCDGSVIVLHTEEIETLRAS